MDFNLIKQAILGLVLLFAVVVILSAGIVYWYIWVPIVAAIIGGIIYRKRQKRAQDMV